MKIINKGAVGQTSESCANVFKKAQLNTESDNLQLILCDALDLRYLPVPTKSNLARHQHITQNITNQISLDNSYGLKDLVVDILDQEMAIKEIKDDVEKIVIDVLQENGISNNDIYGISNTEQNVAAQRSDQKKTIDSEEEVIVEITQVGTLHKRLEVDGVKRDPSLWGKAIALAEDDQDRAESQYDKAKSHYIKLRVEQLAKERKDGKPAATIKLDDFDPKFITIEEFSNIESIPEQKIIEMIRDGLYVGRKINGRWYVSRDELVKEEQIKNVTDKLDKEYIPVEEFAELKGISVEKIIQMVRDGFYRGRIIDKHWYVERSEKNSEVSDNMPESSSFVSRLMAGDFGLAKTYWLFFVLGSVPFNIFFSAVTSVGGFYLILLFFIAYEVPVLLGTWIASDKYTGPKIWAVLAKIIVVISWMGLLGVVVSALKMLSKI